MAGLPRETKALYEMCAIAIVRANATIEGADEVGFEVNLPVFTVSHVARLTNTHPQTLRQYDRLQLVSPQRTEGGARRYSLRDIDRLVQTQRLSQEDGVNLAGIMQILALQEENRQLKRQLRAMNEANENSIFAANSNGDIIEVQRSQNARHWRRDIRSEYRQLPSGDNWRQAVETDDSYQRARHANIDTASDESPELINTRSVVIYRHW